MVFSCILRVSCSAGLQLQALLSEGNGVFKLLSKTQKRVAAYVACCPSSEKVNPDWTRYREGVKGQPMRRAWLQKQTFLLTH